MKTRLVAAFFVLCLFYKNGLSQEKDKFDFQMSHRLQNTSQFNSSNEIKKINNRGLPRTPANI